MFNRTTNRFAVEQRSCRSAVLPSVLLLFLIGALNAEEPYAALINPAEPQPASIERLPTPNPPCATLSGLTLGDLEQMAVGGNPALARARALVGAARGEWVQSGLLPNPSVGYDGQQLGSGGLAEQHGVAFSQEIPTGGKLRLNRAVADRRVLIAQQELEGLRQRVLTDVRVAYYQVLVAQLQVNLAEEIIRVSGEGTNAVDALFRAREVGRVDVLQAQLESEQALIQKQAASNRYESAWRGLTAVIGNPSLALQPLLGDPDSQSNEIEFERALTRLQTSSPEVGAALAEVERARFALDRARAQRIPNVSFQGLVNVVDNGIGGGTDGGVAITMPIPIFDRNQGGIARAECEVLAARQAVSQLTLDLQQRLAPIYETYTTSRSQVERYRATILTAAAESLALTRKNYEAGESGYLSLLTAQRTFAQTNSNYLDAVLRLRTAEAEIEGLLLSGSLQHGSSEVPNQTEAVRSTAKSAAPRLLGR